MKNHFTSGTLAPLALAAGVGLLGLAVVSCFSDRATTATVATTNCTAPTTTAGSTIVFITNGTFQPAAAHVKAGGSVAWVNCETTNILHTSTSDAGVWESGTLNPNAGAFVRTFPATGTFPYHCAVHPGMKATIIVD